MIAGELLEASTIASVTSTRGIPDCSLALYQPSLIRGEGRTNARVTCKVDRGAIWNGRSNKKPTKTSSICYLRTSNSVSGTVFYSADIKHSSPATRTNVVLSEEYLQGYNHV